MAFKRKLRHIKDIQGQGNIKGFLPEIMSRLIQSETEDEERK